MTTAVRCDDTVSEGEWISDESDFYGDEDLRTRLENEIATNLTTKFWEYQSSLPAAIACKARLNQADNVEGHVKHGVRFHNSMEGESCARQSGESIDEFTSRLPPSISTVAEVGPFIWCMNPYSKPTKKVEDVATFKEQGTQLLEAYRAFKDMTDASMNGKAKSVINRTLASKRKQLEKDMWAAARDCGVVSGKWMLFAEVTELDKTWKAVADQTWKGNLGIGAKVATEHGARNVRLICVYTNDFSDTRDVKRVLEALVRMNALERGNSADAKTSSNGIWYKCDAYTHLGIESGNDYGLRASMYGSKDMLSSNND